MVLTILMMWFYSLDQKLLIRFKYMLNAIPASYLQDTHFNSITSSATKQEKLLLSVFTKNRNHQNTVQFECLTLRLWAPLAALTAFAHITNELRLQISIL